MRDNRPEKPIDMPFDDPARRSSPVDRSIARQLFREMIAMQVDDGPLPGARRRELVRFARRLGIDTFEAKVMIRAVEYDCGVAAPAALDDRKSPADTRLVSTEDESLGAFAPTLIAPVALLIVVMLVWALSTLR
ncbi:MAG: hypothetical protein H6818_22805 [Phycisphaerales bacterium]|nr:hypothetical protein [Phycisphaerales bacterium]